MLGLGVVRPDAPARRFAPGMCMGTSSRKGPEQDLDDGRDDYPDSRDLLGPREAAPPHVKATHGVSLWMVEAAMSGGLKVAGRAAATTV